MTKYFKLTDVISFFTHLFEIFIKYYNIIQCHIILIIILQSPQILDMTFLFFVSSSTPVYDCTYKHDISFCPCLRVSMCVSKLYLNHTLWASPNTSQHFSLTFWHFCGVIGVGGGVCVCVVDCVF